MKSNISVLGRALFVTGARCCHVLYPLLLEQTSPQIERMA
jgi:hypothetical protein